MKKKLFALGLVSATVISTMGATTAFASTPEGTGNTVVTYQPDIVSPPDATWAVSMPLHVTLNTSNEATGSGETAKAASIYNTVGVDLDFTIFDAGGNTTDHTSNDVVSVTLANATADGEITMDPLNSETGTVKMALTKDSTAFIKTKASANEDAVGTLTNSVSGGQSTITAKAGISTAPDEVKSGDKYSTVLTFKFTEKN